MSKKGKTTNAPGKSNHAADQRQPNKKDKERDTLYRNLKQEDDAFYERLIETYSAG